MPEGSEVVQGDLTDVESLRAAVDGLDAIVFTHGSHGDAYDAELVDYRAVRNAVGALDGRAARIALMTTIGVTKRSRGHDWKRRGERLIRASGLPYTIVRPGWFDYNDPDQHRLEFLQGDSRWAGDPTDGVVSRQQIAQTLVAALTEPAAVRKTFELVAHRETAQDDLHPLFEELEADVDGELDAVRDRANQPLDAEPAEFAQLISEISQRR